ncbi:acetyl-CoA acetyltransferase [Alphaproteobacteria bacterium]|nr:acetyl-CoA acetyltransferase [Alphaproteobacteria bacterium]
MANEIQDVVIVSACRTAIGKFMGSLKDYQAIELASFVASGAIKRAGIAPDILDEIVMGEVYSHMQGSLPARQVAMRVGLPVRSSACNVNQNCASGMRALDIAAKNIQLGKTAAALVVGVESMSNVPYMLPKARSGYRMGPGQIEDALLHDALIDRLVPGHMGVTAENVAEKYNIDRQACDELACLSHNRAYRANRNGIFDREILPVDVGGERFRHDEHVLPDANMESMARLKPAFKNGGVVTAGNASGVNDGAAAVIIMAASKAEALGVKPLMKLIAITSVGVAPELMGLGPAVAIPKCLEEARMDFDAVEYWEINEAFAAQFIGVGRMLQEERGFRLDMEKVNANGSGIGLGHPIGCTGLRIVVSLYYELERRNKKIGGASLCVGGGPAMCSLWSRETESTVRAH